MGVQKRLTILMKWFAGSSTLVCLLLPACLAAASPKLQRIQKAVSASANKVLRLNSATYDDFTASPRDYSITVVLTALQPQFNCAQCREFDGHYAAVSKQWSRSASEPDEPHFFAVLDFPDGQDVFRRLGLSTAPVLKLFHPTAADGKAARVEMEQYEFRQGLSASAFAQWLVSTLRSDVRFTYRTPIDYSKLLTYLLFTSAALVTVYRQWSFFSPIITGRIIWAIASIAFILTMNSGYMWNQIRHPPYMMSGQNGGINFLAAGYSNQYGVETHIISGVYAALAFSVVTIIVALPKIKSERGQRVGVYLWVGVLVCMHAVLTGLFKVKSPGYPYGLFL